MILTKKQLEAAALAMAQDYTRSAIHGVRVRNGAIEATDGKRLARVPIGNDTALDSWLPGAGVNSALKSMLAKDRITIGDADARSDDGYRFETEHGSNVSFPPTEKIFESVDRYATEVVLNLDYLEDVVKSARLVVGPRRTNKGTVTIRFHDSTPEKCATKFEVRSGDFGGIASSPDLEVVVMPLVRDGKK